MNQIGWFYIDFLHKSFFNQFNCLSFTQSKLYMPASKLNRRFNLLRRFLYTQDKILKHFILPNTCVHLNLLDDQSLYLTFLIQNLVFQFSLSLDGMRHPKPNFFIPKYPLSTIKKGLNFNFLMLFLNILKSCMLP